MPPSRKSSRQSQRTKMKSRHKKSRQVHVSSQPIDRTPSYMYNRMLQYSGIDYPHHIRSANEFAVRQSRRVPATWIQDNYANEPIDLNFQNPNQQPLPLDELRRRIEENEFRRRQLMNMPLMQHQLDRYGSLWDAYLYWNPSKRPPNYQVPNENTIRAYDYNYKGPREVTYEYQDPTLQRMQATTLRQEQEKQHDADLFWNPSKRPADYRMPNEQMIYQLDMNYHGPREITYEYQDPFIRRQHINSVRRKRYLSTI